MNKFIKGILFFLILNSFGLSQNASNNKDSKPLQFDKVKIEKPVKESELSTLSSEKPTKKETEAYSDEVIIKPTQLLDFDEETQLIYGRDRTLIQYKDITLEADRIIYNLRLNEVQAEGNVELTYQGEKVKATSIIYNLDKNEGAAYGVSGKKEVIYFQSLDVLKRFKESLKEGQEPSAYIEPSPSFRLINEDEIILNNISLSTCKFPIPHYRLCAKEAIIYLNQRIFIRSAYLYIYEIPVFYIPFYTRSLKERNPWSINFGYTTELGGYTRFGYEYRYYFKEPKVKNEDKYVTKNDYKAGASIDYYTRRGPGLSTYLKYNLLFKDHLGDLFLFGVNDHDRDVEGKEGRFRWIAKAQLYSQISRHIYFQADVDEFSDSEIYMEFVDKFVGESYGRRPERQFKAAVTINEDYFVSRIIAGMNERISRNRITNYTDPTDNDRDYDVRFDKKDWEDEGLPNKRFGIVSANAPHYQFNSNKIPLFKRYPLYYNFYFDAFNNLDKGLNSNSTEDDAFVRGADLYQTLTYLIRLSEKLTWTHTIGAGASYFDRQYDSWRYDYPDTKNDNGTPGDTSDDYWEIDTTKFTDKDEVLIGRRKVDFKDVRKEYFYGDYVSRLNLRLSESLRAFLKYTYRDGTNHSLGETYESLGSNYTRNDLYNFRNKKHWIEGMIRYALSYPDASFNLSGGQNLQSQSDIYANEQINYAKAEVNYTNQDKTLTISPNAKYTTTQIRDYSDPYEYHQRTLQLGSSLKYSPISKLWWMSVGTYWYKVLNSKLDEDDNEHFNEGESKWIADGSVGVKIGPKYKVEVGGRYDSREGEITRAHLGISRDLHDLLVHLMFGYKKDTFEDDREYEVRIALQPKIKEDQETSFKQEFSLFTIEQESKTSKAASED